MKKAPKIIILITALVLTLTVGLGVVSFAAWTGGNKTVTAEGSTGEISLLSVELDEENSLLVGEGGRFLPYSMPAKIPDRNVVKLVFEKAADATGVTAFKISTVYASGKTANDYIKLYYWNKAGAPAANTRVGNGDWTEITSSAAAISAAGVNTTNASNTLYIAYDTNDLRDMNKQYQITITA